jgi:SpoVK/Ycf46/Vps4 family AAA+-type ATPase
MVEINKIKSMWVGESEKNLKKIFDEYNSACKEYEQTPILLFNESDALINKRISVGSSVDSMQNAMQNILLQEMENFEGIFIATTNLIANLDEAFNRRFLYKLKLDKPTAEVRKKIINDLLPFLKDTEKEQLANEFEVSGGQLENIYRKSEMKFILNGTYPDLSELTAMFEQESMSNGSSRLIVRGYAA